MAHDPALLIRSLIRGASDKRAAAHDRMEKARREVERLDVEVAAYNRALAAITGRAHEVEDAGVTASRSPSDASLSEKWAAIYRALHEVAEPPYSYGDIAGAAGIAGYEVKTAATRTQMMNAVNSGIFERPEPGRFRFTETGLAMIGLPKENEPPSGGSDTEEVAASSNPALGPGVQPADPSPHSGGEEGD